MMWYCDYLDLTHAVVRTGAMRTVCSMNNFCKSNAFMLSYACIAVPRDNVLRNRSCNVWCRELK
jgi:hypothetical protein